MASRLGASSSSLHRRGPVWLTFGNGTTATNVEDTYLKGFFIKYSDLCGNRIKFPRNFTARLGHLIDQGVVLDTNDRNSHFIGVERRNGNIWLADGLDAFSEKYDITLLDTMYFRHDYTDFFDVVMFSPSGLEYREHRVTPTELPAAFFKQIVTGDYFTKMAVPDQFTMAFGGQIQNPVVLIGPDDVQWRVEWEMVSGTIWFTEGWTAVVVNYNIKKRDFIYFKVCDVQNVKVDIVPRDSGMIEKVSRIGRDDTLDADFRVRELWIAKISKAALRRRLPLYVPSRIVSRCLAHRPAYVSVALPSGDIQMWSINWSPGRRDDCNIGEGWHKFKKDLKLKAGQRVRFSRRGYENQFIVELL